MPQPPGRAWKALRPDRMSFREPVSELMREVAATVVTPRFRMLAAHEIAEKSPGEIVTTVDREAERRLFDGLAALGPGVRIIGEEAAEQDPGLLDRAGERIGEYFPDDPTAQAELSGQLGDVPVHLDERLRPLIGHPRR